MHNYLRLLFLFSFLTGFAFYTSAQVVIKGVVKDRKGNPVAYASLFFKQALTGATTDTTGAFNVTTDYKGKDTVLISAIGFEDTEIPLLIEDKEYNLIYKLTQAASELDEVVISAGTIEANNERAVAVLKPLDIVTTAGGQGDIIGAIQTLPGVQRNGGDQTGLMVRGGDVSESVIIVDGCVAQNAFGSNVPGVAQRSRFNPFQFKGTAFSSGGYTARYGQALSSVLDLQTTDLPDKNNMNIGAHMAGIYVSGAKLMDEKNAVEFSTSYTNLQPFYSITPTNISFYKVPEGGSFAGRWVSKLENNSWFKMNFSHSFNKMGIDIPNPATAGETMKYGMRNEYTYFNTSLKKWVNPHLRYFTSFSYSSNTDHVDWGGYNMYRYDSRAQGRAEVWYEFGRKFNMLAGSDIQRITYMQQFDTLVGKFEELLSAGYLEFEYKPINWFAVKPGVRTEYSQLLAKGNVVPRLAFAFKTGDASQFSFAGGMFYQSAPTQYLLQGYKPGFQQAIHYMANYQIIKNDRVFRIEAYYKSYNQLIRENGVMYAPNPYRFYYGVVDNSGSGYAQGIDFFWRDKKSIKNFDYWISYSFIDTKRLYQNYTAQAVPDYVSQNNLNVITKYFIMKWQTNISVSYNYTSGRGYYNPNNPVFLGDKAPDFHNIAVSLAYLRTFKKVFAVFFASLDNITNQKNILGYRYNFDASQKYPILPPMYRTIFLGVNLSLTQFKQDELP